MFKIGEVEIKGQIICAPMAGVTNQVFRRLAASQGAALTYTEMTSNVGLKYNSEKTLALADVGQDEFPVSLQIFGGETSDYVESASYFNKNSNAAIIDINMGCPVHKVAIKSQAGSFLLKTPNKIREIIRAVVQVINKPLTIKIRIGWDKESLTHLEVAKIAEEEGVSAIVVHGRTRDELYSGKADWNAIKAVKQAVKIPVIGNGDVKTPEDAKKMLDETGVDAIMVGRAAMENPWVLKQMHDFVTIGQYQSLPSRNEVINAIIKYYQDLKILKNERVALAQIRGVATNWLKRFGLSKERNHLVQLASWDDMQKYLQELKKN